MEVKVCRKCGRSFPAIPEYFYRNPRTKDGLESVCRDCRGSKILGIAKPGYKICTKCKRELPATNEFFRKQSHTRDGLGPQCKSCQSKYNKEYNTKHREEKNAHNREYRRKNREIINAKAREKYPERKEYFKRYYEENKEYIRQRKKKWALRKREEILRKKKEYYMANKEKIIEYQRRYAIENREKVREWSLIRQKRRQALKRKLLSTLTLEQWKECLSFFNNCCAYCGSEVELLEQEHVIPLSKGGCYIKENIVPACHSCNASKGNKDMEPWYREQPFFSEERLKRIYEWTGTNQERVDSHAS